MDNRVIYLIVGIGLGLLIYRTFFYPEFTERVEVEERVTVDSTYFEFKEKYDSIASIRIDLSDSIEKYLSKIPPEIIIVHDSVFIDKPFYAPLRRFTGSQPFLYGNTTYDALVAGELLNISLENDFRIPQVKQTIERERTVTRTIRSRGLYVGGAVSDQVQWSAGASYLDNLWMFDYRYDVGIGSHSVGVKRKVF
jgi:hypothetical protein